MTFRNSSRPDVLSASWSGKERESLFKALNDARFPALVGDYKNESLSDGLHEDVTLVLRDGKKTQTFTVKNYGELAPKPYYQVLAWLHVWQRKKFPAHGQLTGSESDAPAIK